MTASGPVDTVVGVVLAGGGSRRMGTDKAFLPRLDGCSGTWLGAALECLSTCLSEVWIAGRSPEDLREARDVDLTRVRVLSDQRGGVGPLDGVETALLESGSRAILTLPCDLPFLQPETLQLLLDAFHRGTSDATCFVQPEGRIEAAVTIYRPEVLPRLQKFLDGGKRSVTRFLQTLDLGAIPLPPLLGPQFRNLNSPGDLLEFRSGDPS